jgi:hypothetical protein
MMGSKGGDDAIGHSTAPIVSSFRTPPLSILLTIIEFSATAVRIIVETVERGGLGARIDEAFVDSLLDE